MAVIVKCQKCKKRLASDGGPCPHCGNKDRIFFLDHWPKGRYGGRVIQRLPGVKSLTDARDVEYLWSSARKQKKKIALPKGSTVDDLFPDYLEWYELHRAKTTYRDVKLIYNAHFSELLGKENVESLTVVNFDIYQTLRRTSKVCNRTINKELNYFSGFLKWCRMHKKLDIKPIIYEKLPYKRPRPEILTIDEVFRIIRAADPFYRVFILCLYTLGLRFSEARWLTLNDFNFTFKSVKVIQKGGSEKVLPVHNVLINAIKKLNIKDKKQYIFLNPSTITEAEPKGKPVGDIRRALARICTKAKIDKKINPHMFRHSWGTHMLGDGTNLRIIQRYLGHAQVSTTEIYTHVVLDNLRTASESLLKNYSTK
jgi:integrase